jgi:hypothetical protein
VKIWRVQTWQHWQMKMNLNIDGKEVDRSQLERWHEEPHSENMRN